MHIFRRIVQKEGIMRKIYQFRWIWLFLILVTIVGIELRILEGNVEASVNLEEEKIDEFTVYMELIDNLFSELQCFPVVKEKNVYPISYENTWGAERTYGGNRTHEGCDLMASSNERGKYKVCSMTDGTVRQIGWLEQGGWRIGIESDSGVYYYYAHLDSYEKAFEEGERVVAGQILGRMGDSGYGKEPGTKGQFDVHLHVGIYIKDISGKERAINPYWYLKRLEI